MSELIQLTLEQEEEIIERGFATFIEVGSALMRIQKGRKYYPAYPTFEDYMGRRWGWNRDQGYKQIRGAQIGQFLSDVYYSIHPTHETQVRPLSRLRLPDDQFNWPRIQEAWEEACHLARANNNDVPRAPTASEVKYIVDEMLYVPPPPLPDNKYQVIYADPPWRYDFSMSSTRDIENQYPTMQTEDIAKLAISNLAFEDSVLFLWVPSPKLPQGLYVMGEWDFDYKTCMVWIKDKIGMGYYARQQHELLLIGGRGSLPQPEPEFRPSSIIKAPRTEHSKKPDLTYALIEQMYPDREKIELFAREKRDGWTSWGNEINESAHENK